MVPRGLQLSRELKATSVNRSRTVPPLKLKMPPPTALVAELPVNWEKLTVAVRGGVAGQPDAPQHEAALVQDVAADAGAAPVGHGDVRQGEPAAGGHINNAEGRGRGAADRGAAAAEDDEVPGDRGQAVAR
jgi:hypothetical protein